MDVLWVGLDEHIGLSATETEFRGEEYLVTLSGPLEPARPMRGGGDP